MYDAILARDYPILTGSLPDHCNLCHFIANITADIMSLIDLILESEKFMTGYIHFMA